MINYNAILISGPTASGKSNLALDIAKKCNGVIINADSMQVYNDLSIITAKPTVYQMSLVPHFLYGFIDSRIRFSVGDWLKSIESLLIFLNKMKIVPIIVGGTGLYFAGLFGEVSTIPQINQETRLKWQKIQDNDGLEYIYRFLQKNDPLAANSINVNDKARIIRASEVFDQTGKSIREWQKNTGEILGKGDNIKKIYVCPSKEKIHNNISTRIESMLKSNEFFDEIKILKEKNIPLSYPSMKAIGVREVIEYLEGNNSLEELKIKINNQTKRYAKRQITWAKKKMNDWDWFENTEDFFLG